MRLNLLVGGLLFLVLAIISSFFGVFWMTLIFGVLSAGFLFSAFGKGTPAKVGFFSVGRIITVIILIVVTTVLYEPSRNSFWTGSVPRTVQSQVMGRVIIPFTMTSLSPGQVAGNGTEDCLPQGMWKYVGIEETEDIYYRFREAGKPGLGMGYFEKGGRSDWIADQLPLREGDRYGSILVSTDAVENIQTGNTVIVSGTCVPITITPNLPKRGAGLTPLYPITGNLIFARPS